MTEIKVIGSIHSSRTDKEGNMYLVFCVAPQDRIKAAAIAITTGVPLELTTREVE